MNSAMFCIKEDGTGKWGSFTMKKTSLLGSFNGENAVISLEGDSDKIIYRNNGLTYYNAGTESVSISFNTGIAKLTIPGKNIYGNPMDYGLEIKTTFDTNNNPFTLISSLGKNLRLEADSRLELYSVGFISLATDQASIGIDNLENISIGTNTGTVYLAGTNIYIKLNGTKYKITKDDNGFLKASL